MTPRQLKLAADVFEDKREEQRVLIYMQAVLNSRFVWQKRIPKYEKIFKSKQKAMTTDQMFAMVKILNAQFGGKGDEK